MEPGELQVWEGTSRGWEAALAPNTPQKQGMGGKILMGKTSALGKALEKEGAAPQVLPHGWERRRRRRKVLNEHGGGGWECCLAREGGRGILGAVCSLKTIKVGVPRENQG